MKGLKMEWWGRMMAPIRNGGLKVARHLGYRKSGPGVLDLHNDVRTCEYEDIHILWNMLQKNEKELVRSPEASSNRKGHIRKIIEWAKRARSRCYHGV